MMATEKVCPQHGPYDASYATCPYCQAEAGGGRPAAPAPLDDDMPTDLGASPAGYGYDDDEAPTELGAGRGGAGYLDLEDEEETSLGRLQRDDVTELEFVDTGAKGLFWVKEGPRVGRVLKIGEGTVVGRTDGDMVLDDPKVSNPHAKITLEDETFVIWDFGSKNGTYVNGEKIRAATELKENDTIKIGDTTFVLKTLL
jgi:hypothetical protein